MEEICTLRIVSEEVGSLSGYTYGQISSIDPRSKAGFTRLGSIVRNVQISSKHVLPADLT